MWCVALCHDVPGGGAGRSAVFAEHSSHNIARIEHFLLTAPIASADGVSGVGDDPDLLGSIYCLDIADLQAARAIMESDPFMNAAWQRVDYYEWRDATGLWSDEAARPKGLGPNCRCYVALAQAPLDVEGALMRGPLVPLGSTAEHFPEPTILTILRADDMDDAKARAAGADWIAAVPIAIGRFVRICSAEDIASLRR